MAARPTISIGIPAYNEAANIGFLLKKILEQQVVSGAITEIIIFADGCTDQTTTTVRSYTDPRIILIDSPVRFGLAKGQNVLVEKATGDILVMFDADILPVNNYFIETIIQPFITGPSVGLVGANVIAAKPRRFFEHILAAGHELRRDIFSRINQTDNVYLCHGCARAFSKAFYKKILWSDDYPEDSYSYILCQSLGFRFVFASAAVVVLRCPTNMRDHLNQSIRFARGRTSHRRVADDPRANTIFHISLAAAFPPIVYYIVTRPVTTISYMAVTVYARLVSQFASRRSVSKIDQPTSTKIVVE